MSGVESFVAISGTSNAEAESYLEMAGGDLEAAVELWMNMGSMGGGDGGGGDGGAGGGGGGGGAGGGAGEQYPEWWTLVWEGREPVPEAWIEQGLRFGEGVPAAPAAAGYGGLCLAQGKNGPCGLLAVLQGVVVSQMLKALEARQGRGAAAAMLKAGAKVGDRALATAIAAILRQCAGGAGGSGAAVVARWQPDAAAAGHVKLQSVPLGSDGGADDDDDDDDDADDDDSPVLQFLLSPGVLDDFRAPGGAVLLLYSAVHSRGAAAVRRDMVGGGGTAASALVTGPFALCSSELLMLLLRGRANGNVAAFDATAVTAVPATPPVAAPADAAAAASAPGGDGAAASSRFPPHWGEPPRMQTRDFRELPGGYGMGSGTLRAWIQAKLDEDAAPRWPFAPLVGLLSSEARESGLPLHPALTHPPTPVWVLHGGDHFTTLFGAGLAAFRSIDGAAEGGAAGGGGEERGVVGGGAGGGAGAAGAAGAAEAAEPEAATTTRYQLWHFNGLPPAGPRLMPVGISCPAGARGVHGRATLGRAPAQAFFKPAVGEIGDIVQARPADQRARPQQWTTWTYEVVLAFDDPDVTAPPRPVPEPTFEQGEVPPAEPAGESWRCTRCYATRYKTMRFGMNEPSAAACAGCDRPRAEAGWSLWMHHDDLPPQQQAICANRHAPKGLTLLRSKWRGATFEFEGGAPSV